MDDNAGDNPQRRPDIMRIGFLFNHDQAHQVAHSLPIALALARMRAGHQIVIAVTNGTLAAEVERIGGAAMRQSGISVRILALHNPLRRAAASAFGPILPAAKLLLYGDNLDFFRSLDMLVVTEKTSLLLRRYPGLGALPIVHTRHGAGDRAIGFDKASARFDLVLVAGGKIRDRLVDEAGVPADRIRVVGYPKFDIEALSPRPFADDDPRPVILYNPHVSPHLSSWFKMGPAVLDWFVRHPEYRLIFAPHVMLFHRRYVVSIDRLRIDRPGTIAPKIFEAPNIHIDLGSPASTDMTHTRRADIYLGDVSSQVYEFIRQPRPCVFLDPHDTQWRSNPNFAHWNAGPVIRDVEDLGPALASARERQATHYGIVQQRLFDRTFDASEGRPSERAALALSHFADALPRFRPHAARRSTTAAIPV